MKGFKSPTKCEVCRGRVRHTDRIVGRKVSGTPRKVCARRPCLKAWADQTKRARIMARWPEHRTTEVQAMSYHSPLARAAEMAAPYSDRRKTKSEVDEFLTQRLRQEVGYVGIQKGRLPNGSVERWYDQLRRDHPQWLNGAQRNTIRQRAYVIRQQLLDEQGLTRKSRKLANAAPPPAALRVAEPTPPPPVIAAPAPHTNGHTNGNGHAVAEMSDDVANAIVEAIYGCVKVMRAKHDVKALQDVWVTVAAAV